MNYFHFNLSIGKIKLLPFKSFKIPLSDLKLNFKTELESI